MVSIHPTCKYVTRGGGIRVHMLLHALYDGRPLVERGDWEPSLLQHCIVQRNKYQVSMMCSANMLNKLSVWVEVISIRPFYRIYCHCSAYESNCALVWIMDE